MKDDGIIKILIALSVSNIKSSDFREFVSWLKYGSEDSALDLYSVVRNRLRHIEYDILDVDMHYRRPERVSRSAENDIVSMQRQSGLTVRESVDALERFFLVAGFSHSDAVRFSSKDGFRTWVARCIKAFGENKMLSAAAEVFGRSGNLRSDWKLG